MADARSIGRRRVHAPRCAELDSSPFGIAGTATSERELIVAAMLPGKDVVRLAMRLLLGKPSRMPGMDEKAEGERDSCEG